MCVQNDTYGIRCGEAFSFGIRSMFTHGNVYCVVNMGICGEVR